MSDRVDVGQRGARRYSSFVAKWLRTATAFTIYSSAVMTATLLLFASALATVIGIPGVIPMPLLAMVFVVTVHPAALPYLLATLIVGDRTAHGPTVDAAWNIMFLLFSAPYLAILCWLLVRRVQTGLWVEALHAACLVGLYACICEYLFLAQETIGQFD